MVIDQQTHPQTGLITIHCAAASALCNNDNNNTAGEPVSETVYMYCRHLAFV